MGIEYYLVDHNKKQMLYLGKGPWYNFKEKEYLLYREGIKKIIEEYNDYDEKK